MIVYAVHHQPWYVDNQRRAFARYAPDAAFVVAAPRGWPAIREHCRAAGIECIKSPHGGYIATLDHLAATATEPTVIVEWDVLPIRRVSFEAACSFRGRQHLGMAAPTRRFFYPNVLALDPSRDCYTPGYFAQGLPPFSTPFRELEHGVIEGDVAGLPACCEAAGFSMIGDEYVHHLHGAMRTPERTECWEQVVRQVCPPGLGDMVAAGLSAVGITPERVSAALGVEDCGCKKRQATLNQIGRRLGIG
jgi:hypothetical protein